MIIDRKQKYIHLSSELVITNWDKQDIKTYVGSKHVYIKSEDEIANYYEITEQEHFANEAAREQAEMQDDENLTEE